MDSSKELPWICEEHPDAKIRHSWDKTYCVFNGYPAGLGWDSGNHKYECSVCSKELAAAERIENE